MMNYGNKVTIKFAKDSPFCQNGVGAQIFRNVTEIHYKYPNSAFQCVAFESDIHDTGITYRLVNIGEFETELEHEKAEDFYGGH